MRIAVIIPHRQDRPEFLLNLRRMIKRQTLQPLIVSEIDFQPQTDKCDISQRYRIGYNRITAGLVDLIAFMEVDDWYSPTYLEDMAKEWMNAGRPDIFGQRFTVYYHIFLRKYFKMEHYHRSSAMNTVIVPGLPIQWPVDHEPYTDLHLWQQLNGVTYMPTKINCVGIKHGLGMVGGHNHNSNMHRYVNEDAGFLESILDPESFKFYTQLKQHAKV